jgi:pentatricopeptide repeat protein
MKCEDCRHVGCAVQPCPYGKKEPDQSFQDDCLFEGNCAIITAFLKTENYDAAIDIINKMRNSDKEDVKCDTCHHKCYHKAGTFENVAHGADDPYDYEYCAKHHWTSEPVEDYSNCKDYLISEES